MKYALRGIEIGLVAVIVFVLFDRRTSRLNDAAEVAAVNQEKIATLSHYIADAPLTFNSVALDTIVDGFEVDKVPLRDAFAALAKSLNASLVIHWPELASCNISPEQLSSVSVSHASGESIISFLLDAKDVDRNRISVYESNDGTVVIDSVDHAASVIYTRLYNIRDLLVHYEPLRHLLDEQRDGSTTQEAKSTIDSSPALAEIVDMYIKLIQDTIDNDSWKDLGGSVGAIREIDGVLVITQTPAAHRRVAVLLDRLRKKL